MPEKNWKKNILAGRERERDSERKREQGRYKANENKNGSRAERLKNAKRKRSANICSKKGGTNRVGVAEISTRGGERRVVQKSKARKCWGKINQN